MRLVLFQPDIPQNVGAAIRVAACFGAGLDIVEPCGFPLGQTRLTREIRKVAMDYGAMADVEPHADWAAFLATRRADPATRNGRICAMTTKGAGPLWDFDFQPGDIIVMGRESAGLPELVHEAADARLFIPMVEGARSLNVATAGAIALAEAQRQLSK